MSAGEPADLRHPNHVLDELGFRYDPNNLFQQTANALLEAAEILDLPHHLRLILAQPKIEIMFHFPNINN